MIQPLNIYIGYDSKEPVAYHVLAHSILTRATIPVAIHPLRQDTLRAAGLYTRERGPTESTEFSLTRFLVPALSGFRGFSVFMDCDMLCLTDVAELCAWVAMNFKETRSGDDKGFSRKKGLLCCQHDYTPSETTKFLGNVQTVYPRKNWSSLMVFANDMCTALTPEYVNGATGLELHRFQWISDDLIGSLPIEWNWLVGEYRTPQVVGPDDHFKVLHWTLGGPWYEDYRESPGAENWFIERDSALGSLAAA